MKNLPILPILVTALVASNPLQAVTLDTRTAANVLVAGAGNRGEPITPSPVGGDGVLQNFSGIDWHQNGASLVQGFGLRSTSPIGAFSDFKMTYQGFAATIGTTSPTPDLLVAFPGPARGTYELTTVSTLFERSTCVTANCSTINITFTPGTTSTWNIYFDPTPDANPDLGTGFTDGARILSGTWDSQLTIFTAFGAANFPDSQGVGSTFLQGTVLTTNPTYVSSALTSTLFDSTLNFPGQSSRSFSRPASFNGITAGPNTAAQFVIQADGSQGFSEAFTPIDEPATMALIGIGLLAIGILKRYRAIQQQ